MSSKRLFHLGVELEKLKVGYYYETECSEDFLLYFEMKTIPVNGGL
jgi:hypothetical protein